MRKPENFEMWQNSIKLTVDVYSHTKLFPKHETYSLCSQINRSVISIASNIAEGCSRTSEKDFKRFLEIAIGSLFELQTQLIISNRLGYICNDDFTQIDVDINIIKYQLLAMINKLKS